MFSMKKIFAVTGATAMLMSIAACGNSSAGGGGNKTITFQTWNLKNDKYTSYFTDLIAAYEKANPGTKINWIDQPSDNYEQKLSADAAAGQLPDIIDAGTSQMYTLAKAGALMNLTKEDPNAKNQFMDSAWKLVTFAGKGMDTGAYGFPWYLNDGATYYNKAKMDQCGVDSTHLPKNWNDFFTAANTVAKKCPGTYFSSGLPNDNFGSAGIPFMNAARTQYTFNSAKGIEFLQQWIDLYKAGGVPPEALSAKWSQQDTFFQNGTVISMGAPAYSAEGFKRNSPDLYKNLVVGPEITSTGHSMSLGAEMLGISATTKNKDLTLDFAKYVTNSKNQLNFAKKSNTFPSSKGSLNDPYYSSIDVKTIQGQALQYALDGVRNGESARPAAMSDMFGYDYLRDQCALAMQGKQTAKEALDKAAKYADGKLQ